MLSHWDRGNTAFFIILPNQLCSLMYMYIKLFIWNLSLIPILQFYFIRWSYLSLLQKIKVLYIYIYTQVTFVRLTGCRTNHYIEKRWVQLYELITDETWFNIMILCSRFLVPGPYTSCTRFIHIMYQVHTHHVPGPYTSCTRSIHIMYQVRTHHVPGSIHIMDPYTSCTR
jgi:hypothetical protein